MVDVLYEIICNAPKTFHLWNFPLVPSNAFYDIFCGHSYAIERCIVSSVYYDRSSLLVTKIFITSESQCRPGHEYPCKIDCLISNHGHCTIPYSSNTQIVPFKVKHERLPGMYSMKLNSLCEDAAGIKGHCPDNSMTWPVLPYINVSVYTTVD